MYVRNNPALNSYPVIPTVIPCYGINGYQKPYWEILTGLLTCKRKNPQIEGEKIKKISRILKVKIKKKICF
jgi:hypothetical protein